MVKGLPLARRASKKFSEKTKSGGLTQTPITNVSVCVHKLKQTASPTSSLNVEVRHHLGSLRTRVRLDREPIKLTESVELPPVRPSNINTF